VGGAVGGGKYGFTDVVGKAGAGAGCGPGCPIKHELTGVIQLPAVFLARLGIVYPYGGVPFYS